MNKKIVLAIIISFIFVIFIYNAKYYFFILSNGLKVIHRAAQNKPPQNVMYSTLSKHDDIIVNPLNGSYSSNAPITSMGSYASSHSNASMTSNGSNASSHSNTLNSLYTLSYLTASNGSYASSYSNASNGSYASNASNASIASSYSKVKSKPLIYIYPWDDLPDTLQNRSDHYWGEYPKDYRDNFGMGPVNDISYGQFKTWQFALYDIMIEKLKRDYRRTLNPSLATTFLIPYNFALDALIKPENGKIRQANCPLSSLVIRHLMDSDYFKMSHGHNHLLIVSGNQNLNYFYHAKNCYEFLLNICYNCTKLAIDEYSVIESNSSINNLYSECCSSY
jgi:hypothetical protein